MYYINVEHQGSRKRGTEGGFILPPSTLELGIRKKEQKEKWKSITVTPLPLTQTLYRICAKKNAMKIKQ